MWTWITENATALNVAVNLGMLVIWGLYLQLFLMTYMRQRRATILITRGAGNGQDARCLVTNMSAEAVYIHSVLATVIAGDDVQTLAVTDVEGSETADRSAALSSLSSQGPLGPGEIMDLGPFRTLVKRVTKQGQESDPTRQDAKVQFDSLEVVVIGAYGQTTLGVAARRQFRLEDDGQRVLVPTTFDTKQIRSLSGRRYVRDMKRRFG